MLGVPTAASAQEFSLTTLSSDPATISLRAITQSTDEQAATSAATISEPLLLALAPPRPSLAVLSFAIPGSGTSSSSRGASPEPQPAPQGPYRYNERDYRLEIALGVAIVRFRSPAYYATGVGTHTAVAYFLKDWLAVEGVVTTAFAPEIYANEHIKYLS